MSNDMQKPKCRNMIVFVIIQKREKYLDINLTDHVQNLCAEIRKY